LQQGNNFYRAEITLLENRNTTLEMRNFNMIAANAEGRRRGSDSEDEGITGWQSPFNTSIYSFFLNVVDESFRFPLLGFVNIAVGNFNTVQLGFVNWNTRNLTGVQAGFINTVGGNFSGVQPGFINTVGGNFLGVQAGFINTVAGDVDGLQAGFINTTTGALDGAQIGFVNTIVSGGRGLQMGFVNTSVETLRGVQLGFLNYAESIEGGIPIGFLSIVRHGGYYALEYSFTEYLPFTLGFKIGVEKFYTTIFASANPFDERNNFATGVGFGSIIHINDTFFFNPELISMNVFPWENDKVSWENNTNLFIFVPYFGYNITRNFSASIAPSLTWANSWGSESAKPFFSIYDWELNERNNLILGARAGVRYRF
jgi:hypothetical protein